jgi:hypothetical protein
LCGGGCCDLELPDDWVCVACIFLTPPTSTFANLDTIVTFNDFATSCVTSQACSNKIVCKIYFSCVAHLTTYKELHFSWISNA